MAAHKTRKPHRPTTPSSARGRGNSDPPEVERHTGLPSDVRDALCRLVDFQLTREQSQRWLDCLRFCHGRFEVIAYPTNTFKTSEPLPGFMQPDRAPAQALGFRCNYSSFTFALPTGTPEPPKVESTPAKFRYIEWGTVVAPRDAHRALTAILRKAQYMIAQARLHETSRGATTA